MLNISQLLRKRCTPCSSNTARLEKEQIDLYLSSLPQWRLENDRLVRSVKLNDFHQSLSLANVIGRIAESENHHPDLYIGWGLLKISIFTHAIKGLSENDFILAAKINQLSEISNSSNLQLETDKMSGGGQN